MATAQEKNRLSSQHHEMVRVLFTRKPDRLHLCSLILSAANIPHGVHGASERGWILYVPSAFHDRATTEIDAYDQENDNWPLQPPAPDTFAPFFRAQSVLIIASLMLFYTVTGPWTPHSLWFNKGAVDSLRILADGEYFRLITGLTLHADVVHLLGNCFLGGFLLHFYFLILGNGIGLAALIATAATANYLNVLAHGPGHHAVGFSTAVFAVIGILSALNYRHYKFTRPARLLLPLMAGAAMLAFLGSGNESGRTDLGAHFFGLLAGLALGLLLSLDRFFNLRHNFVLQSLLELLATALIIISWIIALQ